MVPKLGNEREAEWNIYIYIYIIKVEGKKIYLTINIKHSRQTSFCFNVFKKVSKHSVPEE